MNHEQDSPDTAVPGQALIDCIRCKKPAVPEGAAEAKPGRYICARCWGKLINKGRK